MTLFVMVSTIASIKINPKVGLSSCYRLVCAIVNIHNQLDDKMEHPSHDLIRFESKIAFGKWYFVLHIKNGYNLLIESLLCWFEFQWTCCCLSSWNGCWRRNDCPLWKKVEYRYRISIPPHLQCDEQHDKGCVCKGMFKYEFRPVFFTFIDYFPRIQSGSTIQYWFLLLTFR